MADLKKIIGMSLPVHKIQLEGFKPNQGGKQTLELESCNRFPSNGVLLKIGTESIILPSALLSKAIATLDRT